MYKKIIKYTDYSGVEREEEFYFNISKSEIIKMDVSEEGGLHDRLTRVVAAENGKEIMEVFEGLILATYGVRSIDGKHFSKTPEEVLAFKHSAAYDSLFMEIVLDSDAAAVFINAVFPQDMVQEADKLRAERTAVPGFRPGHEPATDIRPGAVPHNVFDSSKTGAPQPIDIPRAEVDRVRELPQQEPAIETDMELLKARLRAEIEAEQRDANTPQGPSDGYPSESTN